MLDNDDSSESDTEPEDRKWTDKPSLTPDWRDWKRDNSDALMALYIEYLVHGRTLFGNAFNQCGTYSSFCSYVYGTLQPGAFS